MCVCVCAGVCVYVGGCEGGGVLVVMKVVCWLWCNDGGVLILVVKVACW